MMMCDRPRHILELGIVYFPALWCFLSRWTMLYGERGLLRGFPQNKRKNSPCVRPSMGYNGHGKMLTIFTQTTTVCQLTRAENAVLSERSF